MWWRWRHTILDAVGTEVTNMVAGPSHITFPVLWRLDSRLDSRLERGRERLSREPTLGDLGRDRIGTYVFGVTRAALKCTAASFSWSKNMNEWHYGATEGSSNSYPRGSIYAVQVIASDCLYIYETCPI